MCLLFLGYQEGALLMDPRLVLEHLKLHNYGNLSDF